jgi:5-oxopent-3-ene-1,2,5-tricarboxylate decarboxylase / 2-hydroxyhepta-2,4-diene-1,7-dioate isomerase
MSALSEETKALLMKTATATLTAQLQRKGVRNTFFTGLRPGKPGQKMVGTAKTLRYAPLREDLTAALLGGGRNAQRRAIQPGEVLVIEARRDPSAGTIGDIFSMRCHQRGAAGIVTDGCVRDVAGVTAIPIPSYFQAAHAATLGRQHIALDIDVPIACADVLVMPGDVIVGDDDGVMVIPIAMVDEVAREAYEQELQDAWSLERVTAGESCDGVFPIAKERMAEYEAWKAKRPG